MKKYEGAAHIPHCMVTQGQAVWAGLATVAANITWQNKVIAGHNLPLSAFSDYILQFEDMLWEVKRTLSSSTMGIFLQKPRSYLEPPQLKRKEPDSALSGSNATSSTKRPRQDEAGNNKN